jgi:hypothetical protein
MRCICRRQAEINSDFADAGSAYCSIRRSTLSSRASELTVNIPPWPTAPLPNVPNFLLFHEQPGEWAQSSTTFAPILPQAARSCSNRPGLPKVCCKITTLREPLSCIRISCGSIHRCSSMSKYTGIAPQTLTASTTAKQVKAQTPTLSPGWTSRALSNIASACLPSPKARAPRLSANRENSSSYFLRQTDLIFATV